MQNFVPKNRRPKFDLHMRIHDLNNVPLVSGTSFIKWHLPSSTAAEHRGKSPKCNIKDHKVMYDYEKTLAVRLIVGKDQMLQETWIHFEILQEYSSGGRGERITLGLIKLNLAEYVNGGQGADGGSEDGITRRYLMQESKINSTLKVQIGMRHVEGDKNYTAPPLRTAPVFGGIAGIMAKEAPDLSDDAGHMPSLSSKSRETGELQDMYRRTLAASWAAQPGELKADQCIEDIFAGGDGWGSSSANNSADRTPTGKHSRSHLGVHDGPGSDDEISSRNASGTNLAAMFKRNKNSPKRNLRSGNHSGPDSRDVRTGDSPKNSNVSGRAGLDQQARKLAHRSKGSHRDASHEIDEFDNPYREDLKSWKVRQTAYG